MVWKGSLNNQHEEICACPACPTHHDELAAERAALKCSMPDCHHPHGTRVVQPVCTGCAAGIALDGMTFLHAQLEKVRDELAESQEKFYEVRRKDLVEGPVREDGDQDAKPSFAPFYAGFVHVRAALSMLEAILKGHKI